MAQIHKIETEIEVKCSADEFYGIFKNNCTQFPKILPQIYKSVQVLEGDGKSVGSVTLWKYVLDGKVGETKEKIKAVDNQSRSITFSTIEGDLRKAYKSFDAKMTVTPRGGDGSSSSSSCLVKWSIEFEKVSEDIPNPYAYLNASTATSKEVGRYLLNKA